MTTNDNGDETQMTRQNENDNNERPKNTDVEWFEVHARIAERLLRAARRLEAKRQKRQDEGKQP